MNIQYITLYIFKHINYLIFKLQGIEKLVCDLLLEAKSFSGKIDPLCEGLPNFNTVFNDNEGIDIS